MGMYELSGDKPGNGAYKAFSFGKKGIEWNYPVIVGTQYGDNRQLYSYVMQSADGQNYSPTDYVALATMDDLVGYVPFAANLPSNQKFYMALVPGDENRIYFYSGENPIGENSIGYIVLTP